MRMSGFLGRVCRRRAAITRVLAVTRGLKAAPVAALALVLAVGGAAGQSAPAFNPNFPPQLSPVIPSDINPALVGALMQRDEVAEAQRVFDIFSWQQFLAINWPTNAEGAPAPALTDTGFGPPAWVRWHESFEIFREDGQPPAMRTAAAQRLTREAVAARHGVPIGPATTDRSVRILSIVSPTAPITVLDETSQAFSHPLWDQHGNLAHYEILMNDTEANYIVQNQLFNLDGQIAFAQNHNAVNLPSGVYDNASQVGAIEIKLAWRILDEAAGDIPSRYFTADAIVLNPDGQGWRQVRVGLVGMHISHKTSTSPQWVWATFEQVDNVQVDSLDTVEVGGQRRHLHPSFNDPNCEPCVVNTYPPTRDPATGQLRTQVTRVVPIPPATQQLNREVQAMLRGMGSVWQYYELVNTQWPTDPSAPPTTPGAGTAPESIENKTGGDPTPVYLVNSIMETYFQLGNQPAGRLEQGMPDVPEQAFGTESCMGCHYSAGIATMATVGAGGTRTANFSGPLTADFSWMFQQLAHFRTPPDSATPATPATPQPH